MRETKLLVIQQRRGLDSATTQAIVLWAMKKLYVSTLMWIGVQMWIRGLTDVDSWTYSDADCPVICMEGTSVELVEFPGWKFHCCGGGDSVAVALVRGAGTEMRASG